MKTLLIMLIALLSFTYANANSPPSDKNYDLVKLIKSETPIALQLDECFTINYTANYDVLFFRNLVYLPSEKIMFNSNITIPVEVVSRSGVINQNCKLQYNYNSGIVLTKKNYTQIGYSIWN